MSLDNVNVNVNKDAYFAFDAGLAGNGQPLSDDARSSQFDWSTLCFLKPKVKKASSSLSSSSADADDLSCLAHANVKKAPEGGALYLHLHGATVERVTHTRDKFHTLFLGMPALPKGVCPLKAFADTLDRLVVDVAKANVEEWFRKKMSGDLIEEYYRGSFSTTSSPALRFVIAGDLPEKQLLSTGSIVNLLFQLVGVQFRGQYFTCVWKILSVEDGHVAAPPPPQEEGGRGGGFGFFPDDEEDPEEDTEELVVKEDDEDVSPSFEECNEMIEAQTARLTSIAARWDAVASDAQASAERARKALERLVTSDASSFVEAYTDAESNVF